MRVPGRRLVNRQSHSDWRNHVTELRSALRAQPDNLDLANRLWALLSGATGFDVRTGPLVIETLRAAALRTDDGMAALVDAFRKLADETGELPRPALFDPPLESRLRIYARTADAAMQRDLNWILDCIESDL
jgi:hypothetical protein